MSQNNTHPLPNLLASRAKLRSINPFHTRTAILLTFVLGMILSFSISVGYLQWRSDSQFQWAQFLFVLCHNLVLAGVVFIFNFRLLGRCLRTTAPSDTVTGTVLMTVVSSLLFTFAYSVGLRALRNLMFTGSEFDDLVEIGTINDLLLTTIAVLVTLLIFTLTRHQQIILENESLHNQQMHSKFEALERQVDPHFLFNSLNTLGGLIGMDDQKAQSYLHQLASAYRYIMKQHDGHAVSLAEEMDFVDNYCSMMQIRYGNNLVVEKHIDSECYGMQIPSISIQLLVENAIKHNVISERHPLTITIASTDNGTLLVTNPLQPKQDMPNSDSSHLGLANLGQRYSLLFHRDIDIRCDEAHFTVELPLIPSQS